MRGEETRRAEGKRRRRRRRGRGDGGSEKDRFPKFPFSLLFGSRIDCLAVYRPDMRLIGVLSSEHCCRTRN